MLDRELASNVVEEVEEDEVEVGVEVESGEGEGEGEENDDDDDANDSEDEAQAESEDVEDEDEGDEDSEAEEDEDELSENDQSSSKADSSSEDDEFQFLSEEAMKSKLVDSLKDIGETTFSAFYMLSSFVDPGLIVDPCGSMSLPLEDVDASRIIAASHQAPFGRGEETIVDENVRNTWQLHWDQFRLSNRANEHAFSYVEEEALNAVRDSFGLLSSRRNIRAEPYKLLLYEKGVTVVDDNRLPPIQTGSKRTADDAGLTRHNVASKRKMNMIDLCSDSE